MRNLSLKEGVLIFVATYIIAYGLGLNVIRNIGINNMKEYFNSYAFLAIQSFFSLTLIILTYLAMRRRKIKLGELLKISKHNLLLGLGLAVLLLVVEHGVISVTDRFIEPSETQEILLKATATSIKSFFLLFFIGAVIAPVSEEIYFRGYMFGAMRRKLSIGPAAILNGIYFGAAHLDVSSFIAISILGAILAYTYEKKDSLFVVIIAHASLNATAILAAFLGYNF
ncbi:CAAX amino terminal protease self- immunity [archaeon]|nr:CAAX amino terminal protease self- immunity [archaeon]